MTIAIDIELPPDDDYVGTSDDDFGDACSILVPVDVMQPGIIQSIAANGVEVQEDTNPAWSSSATYNAGDRVYVLDTHRVYESAKSGNTGKNPADLVNQFNAAGQATWWIDIGPTNRAAMFDGLISSQTSVPSPLVIRMTPGAFNGFALFGIDADSYSVDVRSSPGGELIYSEPTTKLDGNQPADYYDYFFGRSKPLTQFIKSGIDPYSSAEIALTLTKGSGNVKLGMFAIGDLRPVGVPQRDAKVEPQDFSVVKQDAFGNTTVKRRANATGMSISCIMPREDAGTVLNTIKDTLGIPCVVVGSSALFYEWLTVFGLVSASMSPNPYPYATVSITVKGLI